MDLVNLPDLVILHIISLLDVDDIFNLSKAHEGFRELADSNHIWFNRCWNAISPFWAFVELPNKSDSESYMEYFMRGISKNSTQLKEVVFDFSELKIGDETWKRIDNYQFKNDVWKHTHWCGDVNMGIHADLKFDQYMHDVLCFKRNGENKEVLMELPESMRADLFRLSQVYRLPYETNRPCTVTSMEPQEVSRNKEWFRDLYENVPLFSENMTTFYEYRKIPLIFIYITEFLEATFKDLVKRNIFSIHEVSGKISSIIEKCLLEITEGNLGMLYANEESYDKFGAKFAKYEIEYTKSDKMLDINCFKNLFSHLETLLISSLIEYDDNLNITDLVEKREKFMKLSELSVDCDSSYNSLSFLIHLFKMGKYDVSSTTLRDKIENVLFNSFDVEGTDCVRAHILTDNAMVDGNNREQSETVILFMNSKYAVIIFLHITRNIM